MLKKVDEGMKIEINERRKKCRKINIENNKKGIEQKNLKIKSYRKKFRQKIIKCYCTCRSAPPGSKCMLLHKSFCWQRYGRTVERSEKA